MDEGDGDKREENKSHVSIESHLPSKETTIIKVSHHRVTSKLGFIKTFNAILSVIHVDSIILRSIIGLPGCWNVFVEDVGLELEVVDQEVLDCKLSLCLILHQIKGGISWVVEIDWGDAWSDEEGYGQIWIERTPGGSIICLVDMSTNHELDLVLVLIEEGEEAISIVLLPECICLSKFLLKSWEYVHGDDKLVRGIGLLLKLLLNPKHLLIG